jgi:DNA-3-methyladenine glycosylase
VRLPRAFYDRPALIVARDLLGQVLIHEAGGRRRAGRIVETEAYVGPQDLACHASKGRTARTEVMFGPPGHAYMFLIYGMYWCFNVVTGAEGVAAAVLVRALEPLEGLRPGVRTDGPGRLCRALGIARAHNGADLSGRVLRIESGPPVSPRRRERGPRIGVDYAGPWAAKPYRFWIRGNPYVSAPRSAHLP